ncbi:MAG TPA: anthranilate synthase component I, partial [Ochrobactrum intermedium]
MNAKIADSEIFQHETAGGIVVERVRHLTAYKGAIETYIDALNERRGAVFSSNYEYPGRYTRWDTAIVDPPVVITSRARTMRIEALNARGVILLRPILDTVKALAEVTVDKAEENRIELNIAEPSGTFTEEERSRMPSVFTVLRAIVGLFFSEEDANLGLYGAFGYDLAFQFDPIQYKLKRPDDQRDLVLFIPDEIFVADHYAARAWVDRYEFTCGGSSTHGLARATPARAFKPSDAKLARGDHNPGEYAKLVERAKESFKRGDLFEVVPGQTFYERCHTAPSEIFRRLKTINPSPYSFFINLG